MMLPILDVALQRMIGGEKMDETMKVTEAYAAGYFLLEAMVVSIDEVRDTHLLSPLPHF